MLCVHVLWELMWLKWPYYPKQFIDLMQFLSKYSYDIFHRSKTNNSKIHMEPQKTLNSQSNLEKKEKKTKQNMEI